MHFCKAAAVFCFYRTIGPAPGAVCCGKSYRLSPKGEDNRKLFLGNSEGQKPGSTGSDAIHLGEGVSPPPSPPPPPPPLLLLFSSSLSFFFSLFYRRQVITLNLFAVLSLNHMPSLAMLLNLTGPSLTVAELPCLRPNCLMPVPETGQTFGVLGWIPSGRDLGVMLYFRLVLFDQHLLCP